MCDMAESAQHTRGRRRWSGALTAVLALGLAVGATAAFAAAVTQAPRISGDPVPDSQLTAEGGSWTPAGATATFDWLRCDDAGASCVGITGACGRKYTVRKADIGHRLRVRLTVTESNGNAATGRSEPTEVVEAPLYVIPSDTEADTCVHVVPTGPGEGTFTSGTQTGGGSKPPAGSRLSFIRPFPVIRIAGRFQGKKTRLTRVTVRTPRGTRIRIRCSGSGCPFKRRAVAARMIGLRSLQRTYRPKATIEIRVTKAGKIGKYTRVRMRRGKAPVRLDRCVMPGRTKPVRCPAA
jgi:hypothetical protein